MRMWKRAALALGVLCLVASSASAGSFVTVLKEGTIYQQALSGITYGYADSTRIMNLSAVKSLRLGFWVSTEHSGAGAPTDTTTTFAVQVRWHTCGGDTLITGACRDSSHTFVWSPRTYYVNHSTVTVSDTAFVYSIGTTSVASATAPGPREFPVVIGPGHNAFGLGAPMSITIPLVESSGVPFTAPYVSFKWRLIRGPAYCKYTIALLGERP